MNSKEISKALLTREVVDLAFLSSPASFFSSYFLLSPLRRGGGGLFSMSTYAISELQPLCMAKRRVFA